MNLARWSLALLLGLSLAGCETLGLNAGGSDGIDPPENARIVNNEESAQKATATSAAELAQRTLDETPPAQATILKGNNQVVKMPEKKPELLLFGDDVALNFEQAPLTEVIHAVMGDLLGLDYIVEHPIQGEVTLRTRSLLKRDEVLVVLESLLQSNGAVMVRDENDRFYISGSPNMSSLRPSFSSPKDQGPGFSNVIIPLSYISASEMASILEPMADETAFVRVDNRRNLLVLAGTRLQMDGWLEMINTFDIDIMKGMSVGIFPLVHSTVEEVEPALDALIGGVETASGKKGEKDDGALAGLIRVIPLEQLNSILVITPRAHYLERVKHWIDRLDREPDANFEERLYVYPVQNSSAIRLADLLSQIYSGKTSGANRQNRTGAGVSPGLTAERVTGSGSSLSSNTNRSGSTSSGVGSNISGNLQRSQQVGGGSANYSIDDVRIVADEENNALLIYANLTDYRKIRDALERLDVVSTQVIIEASILEVSLTDELEYGLEWAFKAGLGTRYDSVGQLVNTDSEIGPRIPGFSWTVTNGGGEISAVLNTLATQSLINVISTPSVMVLDNHTAAIHVGDQVPVRSSQTVTGGGNITNSVEFRDTGVKLSVTPSVNAGGMVTMTVEQSVTDIGEIELTTGQRRFLERNISSRVAVRTGESVVLGGLIRENVTDSSQGLPGLHQIPVLGALFGTKANNGRRTELVVIITPRVLFNEEEARAVTREMRSRMRELKLIDPESTSTLLNPSLGESTSD